MSGPERLSDALAAVLLDELAAEISRQDAKYGRFGGASALWRTRLAIACLEDEVAEALGAWRDERRVPGMPHTRDELLQVAAVAVRALRDGLPEWTS